MTMAERKLQMLHARAEKLTEALRQLETLLSLGPWLNTIKPRENALAIVNAALAADEGSLAPQPAKRDYEADAGQLAGMLLALIDACGNLPPQPPDVVARCVAMKRFVEEVLSGKPSPKAGKKNE